MYYRQRLLECGLGAILLLVSTTWKTRSSQTVRHGFLRIFLSATRQQLR